MENFLDKIIDMCSVEDLMRGYVYDTYHRAYTCIFCGKIFEEDLIYECNKQLCNARKAVEIHIKEEHKSPFDYLIEQDKKNIGLSDRQIEIFKILYNENDNKEIAEKMETTPATVRSYKFKLREKLRQSKIYSAIFYLIEQKNNNMSNSNNDNIVEVAKNEEIKNSENDKNLIKDLTEKFVDVDLNTINIIADNRRLPIK